MHVPFYAFASVSDIWKSRNWIYWAKCKYIYGVAILAHFPPNCTILYSQQQFMRVLVSSQPHQ